MSRIIWPSKYLWCDSKFLAEPESPGNVIDLYGDYHGNLHSAQRAEIHQHGLEVVEPSYKSLR
jgi:hypothetical protein